MGRIAAVCISKEKGVQKKEVGRCRLIENYGLEGDAHAGSWHRQISLLSKEARLVMENKGAKLNDGDFGENMHMPVLGIVRLACFQRKVD